ncbi:hypothetical protein KBT16_13780 [Nostoc sp. CCCryo 231-06]|nr:hypothetical protein [Nostoc sp. CCCryo 231-06]
MIKTILSQSHVTGDKQGTGLTHRSITTGDKSVNTPPNLPSGVRTAETI